MEGMGIAMDNITVVGIAGGTGSGKTTFAQAVAERLIKENRVNFVCKADYSENSEIHTTVRLVLDKIRADYDFQQHLIAQKQSLKS